MGKLQPVLEDACRCVLADLLSGQALAMKKEDFAASMTQRAADCLPGMIEAIDSRLDKADVEAFRARLRAGLEAQSPTQPEEQP
jgi:hypothetical protein